MLSSVKGLLTTLKTALRRPVTIQYPKEHGPIPERFMGFPALTWDEEVGEPYCTGCMVCVRNCPTQCMKAQMVDNPLFKEGRSTRRKIISEFEINLGRCIMCRICVEVCNFDAIEMSREHELSTFTRNGRRVDLPMLLDMGRKYQAESEWQPPSKKVKAAAARQPRAVAGAATAEAPPEAEQPEEEGQ